MGSSRGTTPYLEREVINKQRGAPPACAGVPKTVSWMEPATLPRSGHSLDYTRQLHQQDLPFAPVRLWSTVHVISYRHPDIAVPLLPRGPEPARALL